MPKKPKNRSKQANKPKPLIYGLKAELKVIKKGTRSHIITSLLTSFVRSVRESIFSSFLFRTDLTLCILTCLSTTIHLHFSEYLSSILSGNSSDSSPFLIACISRFTFREGSIIVFYKFFFKTDLVLSSDVLKRIKQEFLQELGNVDGDQFVIDIESVSIKGKNTTTVNSCFYINSCTRSLIKTFELVFAWPLLTTVWYLYCSVADFDECSSGITLNCHETAECNNTLGSYVCTCPAGANGDGTICQGKDNYF